MRALVTAAERDVLSVIDISALEIDFVRFELLSEFLRPIFSVFLTSLLDLLSLSRQIFRVDPGVEIIRRVPGVRKHMNDLAARTIGPKPMQCPHVEIERFEPRHGNGSVLGSCMSLIIARPVLAATHLAEIALEASDKSRADTSSVTLDFLGRDGEFGHLEEL